MTADWSSTSPIQTSPLSPEADAASALLQPPVLLPPAATNPLGSGAARAHRHRGRCLAAICRTGREYQPDRLGEATRRRDGRPRRAPARCTRSTRIRRTAAAAGSRDRRGSNRCSAARGSGERRGSSRARAPDAAGRRPQPHATRRPVVGSDRQGPATHRSDHCASKPAREPARGPPRGVLPARDRRQGGGRATRRRPWAARARDPDGQPDRARPALLRPAVERQGGTSLADL